MKNIKKLLALLLSACLLLSCLAALAEENDVNVWENGDTLNAGKIDTNGNAGIMIENNYEITVENGKKNPLTNQKTISPSTRTALRLIMWAVLLMAFMAFLCAILTKNSPSMSIRTISPLAQAAMLSA